MESRFNTGEEKFEISLTAENHLKDIVKWSKFLAIVGFVSIALLLTFAVFFGFILPQLNEGKLPQNISQDPAANFIASGMFLAITYSITAILTFFPVLFLYKFSKKAQLAIKERNNTLMEESLNFLRKHYKFIGILTLVIIVFYAILFSLTTASSLLS